MIPQGLDWALLEIDEGGQILSAGGSPPEIAASLRDSDVVTLLGEQWDRVRDSSPSQIGRHKVACIPSSRGWLLQIDHPTRDALAELVAKARVADLGRGMAHEFNNVLHLVLGGVRCLTQVPDQQDEWIRTIRSAVQRGRKLVDDVQPILRVDLPPEELSVDILLVQVLHGLDLVLKTATLTTEVSCPDWLLTIRPADLFSALVELTNPYPEHESGHFVLRATPERRGSEHFVRFEASGQGIAVDLPSLRHAAQRMSATVDQSNDRLGLLIPARAPRPEDIKVDDALCLVVGELGDEPRQLLEERGASLLMVSTRDAADVARDYLEEIDTIVVGRGEVSMEWVLRFAQALTPRSELPVLVVSDVGDLLMLRQHHEAVVFLPPIVSPQHLLQQVRLAIGQSRL